MADGSYPRGFPGALSDESARWVREGLLTDAQRQAILGLYPAPESSGRDRTVLIFSILGALLVGAGVILFFAANWPKIPAGIRVGMIVAAIIGAYGAGYHLQYTRGDYPRLGHALIFLGSLLYGAGIWLIAQIFHLDSHYPTGFLLWSLGILPVAWTAASRPVLTLGALVLLIWTVMEQGGFASFNYLFPLLLLGAVLPMARRLETALVEAAVAAGLFLWFGINVGRSIQEQAFVDGGHVAMALFGLMSLYGVGLLLLGLGRVGNERAYVSIGSLGALAGSYFLTFQWTDRPFPADARFFPLIDHSPYVMAGFGVTVVAAAVGAWLYWRRAEPGRALILPAALVPAVAALSLGLLNPVPRMIIFNLVLFGGTVGLVALGIQRRSGLLVNLGLATFVIQVLTRYFDLFFSAMDKSFFFILGGILLLGGGWLLERNRRRWMQDWGGGSHAA